MITIVCLGNLVLFVISLLVMLGMSYGLENDPDLAVDLRLREDVERKFNKMFGLLVMITVLILFGMFNYGFGKIFTILYTIITYIVGVSTIVTILSPPGAEGLIVSFLWPVFIPAYIAYKVVAFILSPITSSMRDIVENFKKEE